MSNTGIPSVKVTPGASNDEQPEVDVSDEEFLQFDTSGIPAIVTLTKVTYFCYLVFSDCQHFVSFIQSMFPRLGGTILWMPHLKRNHK